MIIVDGDYKVYIHIHKTDGKMYVGITKQDPDSRWRNGRSYCKTTRFYKAIEQFGWDAFDHIIFADHLTIEEASNMEKLLIEKFNLCDPEFGYNSQQGQIIKTGSKQWEQIQKTSNKRHGLSPEHAQKISEANKKVIHTDEWAEHIRKSFEKYRGENHWNYGKRPSDEHLKKMIEGSTACKKEHRELWSSSWKKVKCIETGVEYDCIEDAAKNLNICRSSISECASGKRKSAGGYHWEFVEKA